MWPQQQGPTVGRWLAGDGTAKLGVGLCTGKNKSHKVNRYSLERCRRIIKQNTGLADRLLPATVVLFDIRPGEGRASPA
jgi:hypothetical protein